MATDDKNVNKSIDINSADDQWADVLLSYDHYVGSTKERNSVGWGSKKYVSNTMRNDIVTSKVAYDAENIYFMVETLNDLSDPSDPAWMRLLIDTDTTGISPNWEGFEYIINRTSPNGNEAVIERSTDGWNFEQCGIAKLSVNGKRLQIAVPRATLGLEKTLDFNFKWADNTRADDATDDSGDIMDFYQYGDVAPGGRFTFRFTGATAQTGDNSKPAEKKGCGGSIGAASTHIIVALAFAIIVKKKK